jgi:MoxR-like ATPase
VTNVSDMTVSATPAEARSESATQSSDVASDALPLDEASRVVDAILDEVCRAVVGKRDVIRLILAGLIADGHVLLDDVPGVAKTLTARSIARAAGLKFSRVQFTPDVLPADITGSLVLDLATHEPEFRPGPVFTDLLLADEVNRAPAKTQSALLEAMQERQVTADGTTYRLPRPFLVIATQNPIESEGTYPLPEAQLDRFLLRTTMG